MKHLTSHSRTGLFLMEMIISLLVLSLAACICVRIFAGAKSSREQAREWNHIQELTVTAGEFLEGSHGTADEYLSLYPEGHAQNNTLRYYYDSNWNIAASSDSAYCMELTFIQEISPKAAVSETVSAAHSGLKKILLSFYKKEEVLYTQELIFPVFRTREEVLHP